MPTDSFRALIVANPQSQNGSLGRRWPELSRCIEDHFGPFQHSFTAQPGDATTITARALEEGYEMVVAMGGDGTISEVVDGFFTAAGPRRPDAVLGVLPFGTGGDFRKTMGAPKRLPEGAAALRGREVSPIDVGRLTFQSAEGERVRHYVNIASFGIGGLVDQLVNESSKALGGRISFAWATVRAMRRYRPQRARLRLDGGEPLEVTLQNVAVANGQFFGGGMHVAPHARLDDGLFDVVCLPPMGFGKALLSGHRLYQGTHLSLPGVSEQRAALVEAEPLPAEERILLDVDGEVPGWLPARFEILPRALLLKTPEPCNTASPATAG
jgi:YegS/Rv2252/BmrU family lipid kinase